MIQELTAGIPYTVDTGEKLVMKPLGRIISGGATPAPNN